MCVWLKKITYIYLTYTPAAYTKHDYDDEIKYLTMAKERNLFVTGGSDYHGIPNRYPYHLGEYVVDSNLVNQFIERIRCISA